MTNIIFFRIGWMKRYQGTSSDDKIEGGAKHIKENNWGHELFNFKEYHGYFYGYVPPANKFSSSIKLEKINSDFKNATMLHDVLVIWMAPTVDGIYIVGWYKHADVYRNQQNEIKDREYHGEVIGYSTKTKREDVVLLPIEERTYKIPYGKGWSGESHIWYGGEQEEFKKKVKRYVEVYGEPKKSTFFHYDKDRVKQVEANAINVVTSYYSTLGYSVVSREQNDIGWDLDVKKEDKILRVEVKGTSGSEMVAQLTPNEYDKMNKYKEQSYRIAIVTEALSDQSKLTIFFYSKTGDNDEGWYNESGTIKLVFEEIHSAKITAIN